MYIDGPLLLEVLRRDPFRFPAQLNDFVAARVASVVFVEGDSIPLGGRKCVCGLRRTAVPVAVVWLPGDVFS